ncbi:MAG: TonB-dependent receptor domain-containing protein, partial [Janthinobacterium lividum]
GRAALQVELDDNWTITPSVIGQDERNHGSFGYDPTVGDLDVQHFYPEYYHDRFVQAALTVQGKVGDWDLTYAAAYLDRKINSSTDYTDYAEQYDSLYSGVGGLAGYFAYQDASGKTIDPRQNILGQDHFTKHSEEVRLASPVDNPFRIVAGAFYQRQTHLIHQDYQIPGLSPDLSVNGVPGTLWLTQQNRIDRDYAVFGEASLDITPTLTLTGGGRGFIYDNSLVGFFGFGRNPGTDAPGDPAFSAQPFNAAESSHTGVVQCFTADGLPPGVGSGALLPPVVPGGPCTNLGTQSGTAVHPKRASGEGFTHRLNLTWKATPDVLLYATWSRGFRPGGINRRSTVEPYAADYLTNYEAGFKTTLFDRALRFNGAFFWQEWKKFQFAFLGANSFTEVHNGPNARIKGIEADANLTPFAGLVLTASGTYTDAKIRDNLCFADDASAACDSPGDFVSAPKGTRLPITPKLKVNGVARYSFPLASATGHLQGVVTHQSSASSDIRTAIVETGTGAIVDPAALTGRLAAFTTADFSFGGEWANISAELYVENAFDERAQLSRYQECGSCFQRPYIVTNTPRTIGLRAGYKF